MHVDQQYYVYILASGLGGTLYVGVANALLKRLYEHREGRGSAFTAKYGVHRLVYFEIHEEIEQAIKREKQIKRWKRAWKISLIEERNPNWDDLSLGLS
ncbi:GIY-YIG nuclease family protein [Roseibium album]|uniref:GIY-YIG nuclease superfamily protein n=1 Tax=Roseibium album TaxID=311410 RepID=A0A0M6ZR56_9HYPH|nr:GIY-YIG nuclease family protein [Roseibium album]CTQ59312.1 GIY-YIG nuclease superfamily protein [Roseibium album]CTQ64732.1 GIY-YIG nuclease superfamily protein [Roseibium album]CTQ74635.1 GIY-YIG nuclease superfamily protein [Roseibium album]